MDDSAGASPVLTREQIENWRSWLLANHVDSSANWRVALNAICDMALASLVLKEGSMTTDAAACQWIAVPREPTYEMCKAFGGSWEGGWSDDGTPRPSFLERYKALLAAAPRQDKPSSPPLPPNEQDAVSVAVAEAIERAAEVCRDKLAEHTKFYGYGGEYWDGFHMMATDIEAAIRALAVVQHKHIGNLASASSGSVPDTEAKA